jgi:DNA-binding transcriptional LysR family regulator
MKIDTLGIQAFVAIVEQGSFQKAARSLFISQAALSKRLKNLEDHLGLALIQRTTRSWELSPAGRSFLPRAQRFISEIDSAISEVQDESKGLFREVTVACVASMTAHVFPKAVVPFSKKFPRIRIRVLDVLSPSVPEAVLERVAHFGIGVLPRDYQGLEATTLLKDPFVLMCRDDHPLSHRKQLKWTDVESFPLIRIARNVSSGLLLDTVFREAKLEVPSLYEVQHPSTALALVATGAGAAILPSLFLSPDAYPRVRSVPLVEPAVTRSLSLLRCKDRPLSPAAEGLYAIIKRILRSEHLIKVRRASPKQR